MVNIFFIKNMISEYIVPGTSSNQINENMENNSNIKEGNENNFLY
jgi:hypothetical protein